MKITLSSKARESLCSIITGDCEKSPYRSGPQLVDFFRDFGERDLYGSGFPSRASYTLDKLNKFNGTEAMLGIVENAFDFFDDRNFDAENLAEEFDRKIRSSGVKLALEYRSSQMQGDRQVNYYPYIKVVRIPNNVVSTESLHSLSHELIAEQIKKAEEKILNGDYAGAITNSYTLVEHSLKTLLKKSKIEFKDTEGNIKTLYGLLRPSLNLAPAGETIAEPLKPILDGLQKIVAGLFEISNKASDRHARKYNPSSRHAKLAVNSAYTFCEFVLESYNFRVSQK